MREEFDTFPQWVANLLHPFRHLGEQIRGAYMPSWVLLSMTAVEERVRERKTKL
jgi:hypothetical protein